MERTLLTLALVAVIAVALFGLWRGWRGRASRQSGIAALPAVPASLSEDLAEPLAGLYVSTTTSGSWQDRIVAQGLGRRAKAEVRLTAEGVLIDRAGDLPIFLPLGSLVAVDTAPGIAGKVMGMQQGVLVLTWRLGDSVLDSGIRADDLVAQQLWINTARALLAGSGDGGSPDTAPTNSTSGDIDNGESA